MQEIPYLCGLVTGDGYLESGNNRVVINTANNEFAEFVYNLLYILGFKCSKFYDKAAKEWKLATHSKQLKSVLLKYSLYA